jgi:hypothetical protein
MEEEEEERRRRDHAGSREVIARWFELHLVHPIPLCSCVV